MTDELDSALRSAAELIARTDDLVRVVLSGQRKNMSPPCLRVDMRPVSLKGQKFLQKVTSDGRQTTTTNSAPEVSEILELLKGGFSNVLVEHRSGQLVIQVTKKNRVLIQNNKGEYEPNVIHDRAKSRLLDPADPFLREVGISDAHGSIKPSRQDKYRQVEEFLRLLAPTLNAAISAGHLRAPTAENPLKIVDLGCGSAYLTFATHQYLRGQEMSVAVIGVDIRDDSRRKNSEIATRLGIEKSIEFRAEEIATTSVDHADVVIALHACDTATDDAIAWAVIHGAKLIFVAPCCHHDLQSQLKREANDLPEPWSLLLRHGLLKERFGDLLTDALRAQILRIAGYRTEVIEFVGDDHTPRNLMIRAVKTQGPIHMRENELDIQRYQELISQWGIAPALARRLSGYVDLTQNSSPKSHA